MPRERERESERERGRERAKGLYILFEVWISIKIKSYRYFISDCLESGCLVSLFAVIG